jgi:cell division septation protein DedD
MAENRRGKDGRLYMSRGQMVLLGAAFTLASVVIFALGVFVGKGIEERRLLKKEEPLVKIPIKPSAQEPSASPVAPPKNEITFNETPVAKQSAATNVSTEARGAPRPAERVSRAESKETAVTSPEKKPEKAATRGEESGKRTESAEAADAKDAGKMWRAQVNAFPDERSARQIVDRLKNKGYNAYVTEVQNRGKSWYRVSVGKYNSRDEADKMAELLRSKENYPKAFAASR